MELSSFDIDTLLMDQNLNVWPRDQDQELDTWWVSTLDSQLNS